MTSDTITHPSKTTPASEKLSAIVTATGNLGKLQRTLESLRQYNTYPIERIVVVVQDSLDATTADRIRALKSLGTPITVLSTGWKIGKVATLDYAYTRVNTPWVLEIDDNWEWHAPGFVEASMAILKSEPGCMQVLLRARDDINNHPLLPEIHSSGGHRWQKLVSKYDRLWHGFSFAPALRWMSDYIALGGYTEHGMGKPVWSDAEGNREAILGKRFHDQGMFAAWLAENDGKGFVHKQDPDLVVTDTPQDFDWDTVAS